MLEDGIRKTLIRLGYECGKVMAVLDLSFLPSCVSEYECYCVFTRNIIPIISSGALAGRLGFTHADLIHHLHIRIGLLLESETRAMSSNELLKKVLNFHSRYILKGGTDIGVYPGNPPAQP